MYSVDDFIQRAASQLAAYEAERTNLQSLIAQNQQRRTDLEQRLQTAFINLSATVLPDISESALSQLASDIHAPRLATLWSAMQQREAQLRRELQEIEADEEYKKSAALTAPHTGVLSSQIEEIEPILAKLKAELDLMESLPLMQHLVSSGYGTDRYAHKGFLRFFNKEYLQDWKYADQILERLKATSFLDVASRYSELHNQVRTLTDSLNDLRTQFDRVEHKVHEHESDLDELSHLSDHLRIEAGKEISIFIQSRKDSAAQQLPNGSEAVKSYAPIDGLTHQLEYMDQLNVKIANDVNDLNLRADKLRAEKARYEQDRHRFRNKSFNEEQFAHRFGNERYAKAYNRYDKMGNTIYVFDDYYRPSLFQEFLWWDVMTDGRMDGNFIPEVHSYYNTHPNYSYERDNSFNDSDSQPAGWTDIS